MNDLLALLSGIGFIGGLLTVLYAFIVLGPRR